MNSFARVSHRMPCPICNRPDWCLVARDGRSVLCPRVSEGSDGWRGEHGGGYLHWLDGDAVTQSAEAAKQEPERADEDKPSTEELTALAKQWYDDLDHQPEKYRLFAESVGVTSLSLTRLRAGWNGDTYSFPMRDERRNIIGIQLRTPRGKKFAVRGSRNGLFIPEHFGKLGGPCLLPEGATDTAALLDLAFDAMGRFSARGGVGMMIPIIQGKDVVVCGDNDDVKAGGTRPGQEGAVATARGLVGHARRVRVILPPPAFKDWRQWTKTGATHDDVLNLIANAHDYGEARSDVRPYRPVNAGAAS